MKMPFKKTRKPVKPAGKKATPNKMVMADSGEGPAAKKLNRGIGGLSDEQAKGGAEPDLYKKTKGKK